MNHSHEKHKKEAPRHNMLVVGEKSIFLSHLPMFMAPHNLQFILDVALAKDKNDIYFKDRQSHRDTRIYTLQPEVLQLKKLLAPAGDKSAQRSFKGTVFRGHLERGGTRIEGLSNIPVNVKNIVYSQQFGPGLDKSDQLEYILFGNSPELFLAHVIAAPPDFDQILSVRIENGPAADEIARGVRVQIPGRRNSASQRLKEGEITQGQGHVAGAHQFLDLRLQAGVEFYLEEKELAAAM